MTFNYERMRRVDDYNLRHLASHLHSGKQSDRLLQLLCSSPTWLEVKLERFYSHRSFLDDLMLVLGDFNDPLTADQQEEFFQYYAAYTTVRQQISLYNEVDILTLAYLGQAVQAHEYARLLPDPKAVIRALIKLYRFKPNDELLQEIVASALRLEHPSEKANVLRELLSSLSETSPHGDIIRTALFEVTRSIEYGLNQTEAWWQLFFVLLNRRDLAEAQRALEAFDTLTSDDVLLPSDELMKVTAHEAWQAIQSGQPPSVSGEWSADELTVLLRLLQGQSLSGELYDQRLQVGEWMAQIGHPQALSAFQEAFHEAKRSVALPASRRDIVTAMARAGFFEVALDTARTISDMAVRVETLRLIAQEMGTARHPEALQLIDEALRLAPNDPQLTEMRRTKPDNWMQERSDVVFKPVPFSPEELSLLLKLLQDPAYAEDHYQNLIYIGKLMTRSGHSEALSAFDGAIAAANKAPEFATRSNWVGEVAIAMASVGFYPQALELAKKTEFRADRAGTLRWIAQYMAKAGHQDAKQILQEALYFSGGNNQAETARVGPLVARFLDNRDFGATAAVIHTLPYSSAHTRLLGRLAAALAKENSPEADALLREVEASMGRISPPQIRTEQIEGGGEFQFVPSGQEIDDRLFAFLDYVGVLIDVGHLQQARHHMEHPPQAVARAFGSPVWKLPWGKLAQAYLRNEDWEQLEAVIDSGKLSDPELIGICRSLIDKQLIDDAFDLVELIRSDEAAANAEVALLESLAANGYWQDAEVATQDILSPKHRALAYQKIWAFVPIAERKSYLSRFQTWIDQIQNQLAQSRRVDHDDMVAPADFGSQDHHQGTLAWLIQRLLEAGEFDEVQRRMEIFDNFDTFDEYRHSHEKDLFKALTSIGIAMALAQHPNADNFMTRLETAAAYAEGKLHLIERYAGAGLFERASRLAESLRDESTEGVYAEGHGRKYRTQAFQVLSEEMFASGQYKAALAMRDSYDTNSYISAVFSQNHISLDTLIAVARIASWHQPSWKRMVDAFDAISSLPQTATDYVKRAERYRLLKLTEHASDDYTQALKLDSACGAAYLGRGGIAFDGKLYAQAITDLTLALQNGGDAAEIHLWRGYAHLHRDDYDAAAADFRKRLELVPTDAKIYISYGGVLNTLGRSELTLTCFDHALTVCPQLNSSFEFWFVRGYAFEATNRLAEALEAYNRVIELNPDFEAGYDSRNEVQTRLSEEQSGRKSKGRVESRQSSPNAPTASRPSYMRSERLNALLDAGHYSAALTEANRQIADDPDFSEAHMARGISLGAQERFSEGIAAHTRAIGLQLDYALAYCNRGLLYMQTYDDMNGLADFLESARLDPSNEENTLLLGMTLVGFVTNPQVANYVEIMAQMFPALTDSALLEQLRSVEIGVETWAKKDYRDAIKRLTKLTRPKTSGLFQKGNKLSQSLAGKLPEEILGEAEQKLQDGYFVAARDQLDAVIRSSPKFARAHALRGEIHRLQSSYTSALQCYNEALRLEPSAEHYYYRGSFYEGLDNMGLARADFERALELAPKLTIAQAKLGILTMRTDHPEAAQSYLDAASQAGNPTAHKIQQSWGHTVDKVYLSALIALLNVRGRAELNRVVSDYPLLLQAEVIEDLHNSFRQLPPPMFFYHLHELRELATKRSKRQ